MKNRIKIALQAFFLLVISSSVYAQECGESPTAPAVVDGASATLEELKQNSDDINAYIVIADEYLDCTHAFEDSRDFDTLGVDAKEQFRAEASAVLAARNEIADEFNLQVAAYQEANPDAQ